MSKFAALILSGCILIVSLAAVNAPSGGSQQESLTTRYSPSMETSSSQSETRAATLADVLELAQDVLEHMQNEVDDYTGTLIKRERIGGKLGEEAKMSIKIRNPQPESERGIAAYLKFIEPASAAGREVIWADGQNAGKLIAHEAGMKRYLGRFELDPVGRLAMMGQKYPITEIGMIRLAEKLIEKGQDNPAMSRAEVTIREDVSVGDRKCRLIQVTNPTQSPTVDFHIAQILIDMERMIPLRYAAYMWPDAPGAEPPLEEEYTYLDIELNVGLADEDFDPDNTAYDYP